LLPYTKIELFEPLGRDIVERDALRAAEVRIIGDGGPRMRRFLPGR
jgi:hypothetical protein